MRNIGNQSEYGLENLGLYNLGNVYWNLSIPELTEEAILRREGVLAQGGGIVVKTGYYTGRAPNEKFVVKYGNEDDQVIWWGSVNKPISPDKFEQVFGKMRAYLRGRDVFVQDMMVGAHPQYQVPIRIITEHASYSLASRDLFLRLSPEQQKAHVPEFTLIQCPFFYADPKEDSTRTGTFILVNFTKKILLVGGTGYAGEIKKSIFTMLNYVMPRQSVLSMHCGANIGKQGDVALFFGLSGTGKTTLSADPDRNLIGDDEHGWCEDGVFNFEGGCYAKTIRLKAHLEPIVWEAIHRSGALIENVTFFPDTRQIDFDSAEITENTRAAYPLEYVANYVPSGRGGHPKNIFFLTADAFGVIPPIARLTPDQAMYYFLSGYTSKLAGTEAGLGQEPQATFSTCFGAPFLPLYPGIYAGLLGEKVRENHSNVWLVNTGWTGGPFGVGERINLPYTRAMIRAILTAKLDNVEFHPHSHFGFMIPKICPNVPDEVLDPLLTWNDPTGYDQMATQLVSQYLANFAQFESMVPARVKESGPHL